MVPVPATGRRFRRSRPVRLGDVRPEGTLRLDALARYAQDVSNDDTTDARLADDLAWVVRRMVIEVASPARFGEPLELLTFCGGIGSRWAERRVRVSGGGGASYDLATLWVHVDPDTGRPRRLSPQFRDLFAEAAGGRTVGARLGNPRPPDGCCSRRWEVRAADLDLFGHVNNAAYWEVIEELLADDPFPGPVRAVAEYGPGLSRGASVDLAWDRDDNGLGVWLVEAGTVHASFRLEPRS
jgi:acyl-ACP thioesterase